MRHFVYFSRHAATSGNFSDLMKAGRMDIAIHTIIQGLFLSHDFRKDVKMHLVFYGAPDPPKHIELQVTDDLDISKKDIGSLIKKILYKYKEGKKTEVFRGCFVEKKSLLKIIEELNDDKIFILDKKGENIRNIKFSDDCVFIIGDHDGIPNKELKRIKQIAKSVSVGNKIYFASQVVAVVNNELDFQGI